MSSVASVVAAIGWDPEIRGILAVAAGVIVLVGSVYLLLGTNLAWRLGFLVAASALFGWIAILSFTFWMQPPGNGPSGRAPEWEVEEVAPSPELLSQSGVDEVREFSALDLPDPAEIAEMSSDELEVLNQQLAAADWELLPSAGGDRAEIESAVEAAVAEGEVSSADLAQADDIIVTTVAETGGEPERQSDAAWDRVTNKITNTLRLTNPPRYALIQLVPATTPEPEPGEPPPEPAPVPGADSVAVVFVRDLGTERVPAGLVTLGSLAMLGVLGAMMHKRDELVAEHQAAPLPATTGPSDGG